MKSHITRALVGASVVALGFSSIAATGAAWRASAPASSGPTLNAGKLDISSGNLGDSTYELSDFAMSNMTTGSTIAKPLEVFNSGNVPMKYALESVVVTPEATATAAPPLLLKIGEVSSAGDCGTNVDGNVYPTEPTNEEFGPMDGASTSVERLLPADGSEFLCLVASLGTGAEAGQSGKAAFTFRALVDRP